MLGQFAKMHPAARASHLHSGSSSGLVLAVRPMAPGARPALALKRGPQRAEVVVCAKRKAAASAASEDAPSGGKVVLDAETKAAMIASTILHVNKQFGANTVTYLQGVTALTNTGETFSSGCLPLDIALGGGLPRGRIVEVSGPESCGKSTLALHAVAEVQRAGGTALYIDVENALDKEYAQAIGVDTSEGGMILSQPNCGEEALEVADTFMRSGAIDLVIVDSVAALIPRAELLGDIGQPTIGLQARLMSSGLRKLSSSAAKHNVCLFFINQIRNKIGVLYGSPETTSGGNALKYYCSVRIDLRKKETITGDGAADVVGIKVRAKITKNKVAAPFREAMFNIMFGTGIDNNAAIFEAGLTTKVIVQAGAMYAFGGEKYRGRDKAIEAIMGSEESRVQLENEVREALVKVSKTALAVAAPAGEVDEAEPPSDEPPSEDA